MTSEVPALPKKLGRFTVGAKIGGGGMATVYLGRARTDGREEVVALKVIRDELAHDENFRTMFVDEAKILARLEHPNVIRTLEFGLTGDHRFIAMELLAGRTYADAWDVLAAKSEKVDLRLAAWICARVAQGLHSAHELVDESGEPLSVIHRDVNPTNIFLTHGGSVKLIDFGLARARVRASKSVDGIVKGKIPYLAPEQVHGGTIDRRVDVYALGATLWESATMKRLFKRDTDLATLHAIRDAHVPDVRETDPEFPEALWTIIARALERDPAARYPTADALAADLDAFVGDASDMPAALTAMLERLFPGQEAQHTEWLRSAAAVRMPMHTMPPPAPLPTASSRLLEDDEDAVIIPSTPRPPKDVAALASASEKAEAAQKTKTAKKGSTGAKSTSTKASGGAAELLADRARDAAGPKRLVVSLLAVAVVVAIVVALAAR